MPASRWFVRTWILICGLLLFVPRDLAQMPEGSADRYIEKVFEARIGELPRMGWFSPTRGFLALEEHADEIFLFAPIGTPATGRKTGTVSGSELKNLRREYRIACEIRDSDRLTAFDMGRESEAERALFITKKMPGESHAGLVTIPFDDKLIVRVNRRLGWLNQGTLRRDEGIGVRPQSFFYSLHRLYDAKTGLLSQEAIVLHGKNGEILHSVTRRLDSDQLCDGCGIPSYVDAGSGLYRPLNMFELPGFAYPILLLDSSTVEGRALSLLTFTPDGNSTQFRVYEYVVHCGPSP